MQNNKNKLSPENQSELLNILRMRFEKNSHRHENMKWSNLEKILIANPSKIWSLNQMEISGGEPSFIQYDKQSDRYLFFDCSSESPIGRRSCCYDKAAQESRKEHPPKYNAVEFAERMGIELMDETQYRLLQSYGDYDSKTSSWLKTPVDIRELGGAIFGDFRFGHVFVYHNGVQSYYAGRGFRGVLKV